MFPEIVRDDIFRLETRRLWLRWPIVSDTHAPDAPRSPKTTERLAQGQSFTKPTGAKIAAWRSEMEHGSALHLMLVLKGNEHDILGAVHLSKIEPGRFSLRYSLDQTWGGMGLMTEAVLSAVDAAFLLSRLTEICASPAALDMGGRRVLERCGFTYLGNGMREDRSGKGLVACEHFRLERKTWSSLKGWGLPGFAPTPLSKAGLSSSADPSRCVSV